MADRHLGDTQPIDSYRFGGVEPMGQGGRETIIDASLRGVGSTHSRWSRRCVVEHQTRGDGPTPVLHARPRLHHHRRRADAAPGPGISWPGWVRWVGSPASKFGDKRDCQGAGRRFRLQGSRRGRGGRGHHSAESARWHMRPAPLERPGNLKLTHYQRVSHNAGEVTVRSPYPAST